MSEISVFTDLHHESLYQSLQLLFEKRLGWRLFRPAGLDWFQKGYWRIAELYNNAPDTISQFLELRGVKEFPYIPPFTGKPLNKVKEDKKNRHNYS